MQSALAIVAGLPAAALVAPALADTGREGEAHSWDGLVAHARDLAASPYARPEAPLAPPFADLTLAQYRAITPDPAARIDLGGQPGFALEPLAPGFVYADPVRIARVEQGEARWIDFSPRFFRFDPAVFDLADGRAPAQATEGLAFSGFRLRHPLNRPDAADDILTFQGASQFSALARGLTWGASARGLAIATANSAGEEFPAFTHFWVHAADAEARAIRIHALLDSPSVAGAYAFEVVPGAETIVEVRARLFPRAEIGRVGIAPLSSMYFFGPDRRGAIDDIRDAVHDSDGLQMITGRGERVWRPLSNPATLQLSGFIDDNPRAFGLTQRRRDYADFGDAEAGFERRPSVRVEPRGDWGRGQVVLVEIPLPNAANDNIVAFWRPEAPLAAGGDYAFDYSLLWAPLPPDATPLARVIATRSGAAEGEGGMRIYAVDFVLGDVPADRLEPVLAASRGSVSLPRLVEPPRAGQLRVLFRFHPDGAELSELRLILNGPDGPASETWLHRWTPA